MIIDCYSKLPILHYFSQTSHRKKSCNRNNNCIMFSEVDYVIPHSTCVTILFAV